MGDDSRPTATPADVASRIARPGGPCAFVGFVCAGGVTVHTRLLTHLRVTGLGVAPLHHLEDHPEAIVTLGPSCALVIAGCWAGLRDEECGGYTALMPREEGLALCGRSGVRRGHGGSGRRGPTSVKDLLVRAEKAGMDVRRGTRHHQIIHPVTGAVETVPCTPSDHRSIPNTTASIRRNLGVDLRDY